MMKNGFPLWIIVISMAFIVIFMPTQQAFAVAPTITSYVANDPDDGDTVYSDGDTLTINLSEGSNATANSVVTTDAVTGNFTLSPNALSGATFTAQWNGDASALVITFTSIGTVVAIDTSSVVVAGTNNLGITSMILIIL